MPFSYYSFLLATFAAFSFLLDSDFSLSLSELIFFIVTTSCKKYIACARPPLNTLQFYPP